MTRMMARVQITLALWLLPWFAHATQITTPAIITETLGALKDCLKWMIIGVCVWLDCGLFGCSVKISVQFGHYNPDLVISGYHRVGENPWIEMAAAYGGIQRQVGQAFTRQFIDNIDMGEGDRPDEKYHRSHEDLRFKEADAIGNPVTPAALLANAIAAALVPENTITIDDLPLHVSLDASPLICPSETLPFVPYFLSSMDFIGWRLSLPEMFYPQALIPGMREIGSFPINTWGAVYPRSGFVLHAEDPHAGAVVSQRAGDIVTRTGQPHVYLPTAATRTSTSGVKVWYPGPLYEKNRKTGMFQMLVPRNRRSCEVFGQTDLINSWSNNKNDLPPTPDEQAKAGNYAFNLWRPYKCCRVKGQKLITVIEFVPYPP